jgi:hypothetical protein
LSELTTIAGILGKNLNEIDLYFGVETLKFINEINKKSA